MTLLDAFAIGAFGGCVVGIAAYFHIVRELKDNDYRTWESEP